MRFSSYALPALAANLAAAMPRPQDIDLDMVLAAPDPTYSEAVGATAQTITVDPQALIASATAAVSSVSVEISDVLSQTAVVSKRAAATPTTCAQQPAGASSAPTYAPGADTDNVSAFRANTYYSSVAAAAPTPSGYTQSFKAQTASNNAFGYMGFDTFDTYDVNTCAQRCTAKYGCVSFNMYFERDPSVNPDDSSCSNPSSVTMIKCVYWGGQVTQDNAQNVGQMRGNFQVAIAGSNGYVTTQISTPAGYQNGVPFGKFAINAPYDAQGYNTYMGAKIFTGTWDVSQCSNYCDAQTKYNSATAPKDGTPAKVCKFFNTYLLQAKLANGTIVPQGQYCSLYTEAWPIKYAVNGGQWRGQDQYTVDYSFGYAKVASSSDIDPTVGDSKGATYQAVADIKWSSLQPFCSTYLTYTTPVATVTATATITPVVTSTAYSTTTVLAKHKRDDGNSTYPGLSTDSSVGGLMVIDANGTSWYSEQVQVEAGPGSLSSLSKRDTSVAIPAGLAKYQPAVISAACSMQVKPVSFTSTLTTTATTVTGATATTVVSAVATQTAPSVYFDVAGGTFSAAHGGVAQFISGNPWFFAGLDTLSYKVRTAYNARLAIDSSSGYLQDVTGGRIGVIYSQSLGPKDVVRVYFVDPQKIPSHSQPLTCTAPPANGAYTLSCSVITPAGLVISNFIGDINWFNQGYSILQLSASPASELDSTLFGAATITIKQSS